MELTLSVRSFHRVDDAGRTQELAFERPAVDLQPHRLREVPLGDGGDGAGYFRGGPEQVVQQCVDRGFHLAPGAAEPPEGDALPGLPFLADALADAVQLLGHAAVGRDDLVERVGDLTAQAGPVARQPDREVAVAHRLQGMEQLAEIERRAPREVVGLGCDGTVGSRMHGGAPKEIAE